MRGSENFRKMALIYYINCDIAIFVYCIDSKNSFEELKEYWVQSVKEILGNDIIFGLVGTKIDLFDRQEISRDEGIEYATKIGATFIETSAAVYFYHKEIELFINGLIEKFLKRKEKESKLRKTSTKKENELTKQLLYQKCLDKIKEKIFPKNKENTQNKFNPLFKYLNY